MGDKKDEEKKEEDDRLEFVLQYLIRSSKLKQDKWAKMTANEDLKVSRCRHHFEQSVEKIVSTPSCRNS